MFDHIQIVAHGSEKVLSKSQLLSVEDRLHMQAIVNLKRSGPEGRELFENLCCDTHDTLVQLQTLPAILPIELAVKREVSRLALERQRAMLQH